MRNKKMKINPAYLLAFSLAILTLPGANSDAQSTKAPAEDLNVLSGPANPRRMLPDSLDKAALRLLAERERRVAQLSTREEILGRQQFVREKILQAIGGLPERTPLTPKVTGTLKRNGYQIEKVIFESQPAFYVTANLYLPETGRAPYPGILMPLGHESGGKAHEAWQRLAITFAKNGFAILLYEPISQGERVQLYDPDLGESKVRQATNEHTLAGTQCLLLGHNFARHRIWDGMRALDYWSHAPRSTRRASAARGIRPAARGTEPAAVPRRRARSGGFRHRLRAQTIPDPFGDARFLSNRRDTSDFPRSEAAVRADGRRREAQYGRGGRRTRLHPTAPSRRLSLDESLA